jgi:fumarate hydratase class II
LWGAQTQRAVNNFPISGLRMPPSFIRALALIKWAAARTNRNLGLLPEAIAGAVEASALEVANGMHADQFPIDVFQTGSGTSSNMNANEVIARLATQSLGSAVHPNDHVNMSQSSNDSIPSAIHVAAALEVNGKLLPALEHLAATLAKQTGIDFHPAENFFEALSSQDTAVELSGQLKTTAVSIMKIANDLRWMNSGPLAGLAEIALPDLQPGSSIMPGKVNPVIPEAAAMVAAQVIGNDATVTIAGQSGNFQLNVMLPVVALNLLQSIELLANVSSALADAAIKGFKVNQKKLDDALDRNPILVTALNSVIGYDKGAAIAKQAYKEGRAIRDVAAEQTKLSPERLRELLDPLELTKGGIKG